MKYEVSIIQKRENNGIYYVLFKYWESGKCACLGEKKSVSFPHDPSTQDLINII